MYYCQNAVSCAHQQLGCFLGGKVAGRSTGLPVDSLFASCLNLTEVLEAMRPLSPLRTRPNYIITMYSERGRMWGDVHFLKDVYSTLRRQPPPWANPLFQTIQQITTGQKGSETRKNEWGRWALDHCSRIRRKEGDRLEHPPVFWTTQDEVESKLRQ